MKLLLWDIDGTLLLTGGAGKIALNQAFKDLYNVDEIWQQLTPDGRTDHSIVEELYVKKFNREPTQEEKDKIAEVYIHYLEKELPNSPRFEVLPHVENILAYCHLHPGITQGLATGNYEKAAYLKLKRAGLDQYFNFGGFGTDSQDRFILTKKAFERACEKLNGEPVQTFVIGDTIYDIRCGKAIGAFTVGVTTGNMKRDVLEKEGADLVIDNLDELLDFLKKL